METAPPRRDDDVVMFWVMEGIAPQTPWSDSRQTRIRRKLASADAWWPWLAVDERICQQHAGNDDKDHSAAANRREDRGNYYAANDAVEAERLFTGIGHWIDLLGLRDCCINDATK